MGAVFERAGLRGARAAVAADDLTPRPSARFGIDRPDTRFGLELQRPGRGAGAAPSSRCSPARSRPGGVVRGINAGARELPRSELDALTELAKQHGAKGLVWAFVQEDGGSWRSPIAKFLSPAEIAAVNAGPRGQRRAICC